MADFSAGQVRLARHGEDEVRPAASDPRPLDGQVRAVMEGRFGQDFSRVRVHTEDRSAVAHGALAYTVGSEVRFAPGRYQPDTPPGRALLAHELAHVVQQGGQRMRPRPTPPVGEPGSSSERAADLAAHVFGRRAEPDGTLVDRVRDGLSATRLAGPQIARAVHTWAGDFDTEDYQPRFFDQAKTAPRGVHMRLHFKPGGQVDATKIGFIQSVVSRSAGRVVANPTNAKRMITSGEHIDQRQNRGNPVYGSAPASPGDKVEDARLDPVLGGQWGFRKTQDGRWVIQDAVMDDLTEEKPMMPNSGQRYETTAVALEGNQKGAYYGSVSWGWHTNSKTEISLLPMTRASEDTPSPVFEAAAGQWSKTKTSADTPDIPVPAMRRRFTNITMAEFVSDPANAAATTLGKLPRNTRVEVIDQGSGATPAASAWRKVTIIDVPWADDPTARAARTALVGQVGWVSAAALSPTMAR